MKRTVWGCATAQLTGLGHIKNRPEQASVIWLKSRRVTQGCRHLYVREFICAGGVRLCGVVERTPEPSCCRLQTPMLLYIQATCNLRDPGLCARGALSEDTPYPRLSV